MLNILDLTCTFAFMRYRSEHRHSIEIQPDFFSQYPPTTTNITSDNCGDGNGEKKSGSILKLRQIVGKLRLVNCLS